MRARTKATTSPMTMQVAEARAQLAYVLRGDLPELEAAIAARDFDLAMQFATTVRAVRQQVRSLLAGGDTIGVLRAEWGRAEARIDAALVSAPRPGPSVELSRRQWALRLARGTSPLLRRPPPGQRTVALARGDFDAVDTIDEPFAPRAAAPPEPAIGEDSVIERPTEPWMPRPPPRSTT